VISSKYLDILRKKTMEKTIVEEMKEGKRKDKKDK
jgi:hypothetical protein